MSKAHKFKILFVEDDELLREVYALKLEMAGYDVMTAENGQIGLEKLSQNVPDIVLLDMMMPVMSGLEFLEEAQVTTNYPELDVIVFSNITVVAELEQAKALGARACLKKSAFTPDQLVEYLADFNAHQPSL